MKSQILVALVVMSFFLGGCAHVQPSESFESINNESIESMSTHEQVKELLAQKTTMSEIDNPNLEFPSDIHIGQVKKYFKMGDTLFALALRRSMNIDLSLSLPKDFVPSFSGIVVATEGDAQWSKYVQFVDAGFDGNNPYYLITKDGELLVTVVDVNGAGSGEGIEKVFTFSPATGWNLSGCYYFGLGYLEESINGDYFAFSTQFDKHKSLPLESCKTVELVVHE